MSLVRARPMTERRCSPSVGRGYKRIEETSEQHILRLLELCSGKRHFRAPPLSSLPLFLFAKKMQPNETTYVHSD
jgi:hypothetical protein